MDLSQYKSNSNASKVNNDIQQPEKEPVVKVASGRVVSDNPFRKMLSEFVAEDIHNIKDFLIYDVFIPAVKDGISNTVDVILYGQGRAITRGFNGSNTIRRAGNTPYSSLYSSNNRPKVLSNTIEPEKRQINYRNAYTVQDVLIPYTMEEPNRVTENKAKDALATLRSRIARYGFVSVADFYETVLKEVPDDIQDHKWGWYDLSGAYIQKCRDGYILRMPKNIEPYD